MILSEMKNSVLAHIESDKVLMLNTYGNKSCVLHGFRGSVAHNLYVPNNDPNSIDDIDTMGVFVADKEYYLGMESDVPNKGVIESFAGQYDIVLYEIRKFMSMAVKCNPNVIQFLWMNDDNYFVRNKGYKELLRIKNTLLNKTDMYNAFVGYAYNQLNKMEKHAYNGYMGQKRKSLVDKHGYDTKNASHLIRLLVMGTEALTTGELQPYRTYDRDLLLDIKHGEYTLEQVKEMSDYWFSKIETAKSISKLPEERLPLSMLNDIVMDIIEEYI